MLKKILFGFLLFGSACGPGTASLDDAGPDAAVEVDEEARVLRVLFLGNSYTSVNNLPEVVASLSRAESSNFRIEVGRHTVGSQNLEGHNDDSIVEERIAEGWDYVVLQDQSQQPFYFRGFKEEIRSLDTKIKESGAKTLLFMTWSRSPELVGYLSYFEQNLEVSRYYEEAGETIRAPVAPVGRAWERVHREDPLRNLYSADGSHPNVLGTYLSACVFYETLTGQTSLGLGDGGLTLEENDMAFLQSVATGTMGARSRPASPLLGSWPLGDVSLGNDIMVSDRVVIGDAPSPSISQPLGTHFSQGFAAIPYFAGTRTPNIALSIYAHRDDWSVPTTHDFLHETLVARYAAYWLSEFETNLVSRIYTTTQEEAFELRFDVSELAAGWHHFVVSFDGQTHALFIDGARVVDSSASGELRYSNAGLGRFNGIAVGGAASGSDTSVAIGRVSGFSGALSDLKIFERGLSADEIEAL